METFLHSVLSPPNKCSQTAPELKSQADVKVTKRDREVHARGRSHCGQDMKFTRVCLLSGARLPLPGEKCEEVVSLSVCNFQLLLPSSTPILFASTVQALTLATVAKAKKEKVPWSMPPACPKEVSAKSCV
jgi:hypothetical protein